MGGLPAGGARVGSVLDLLAHAAPVSYKFPLPIWLYVLAGGAAVLLSAPAAAFAVRDEAVRERRGAWFSAPRWLGPLLTTIAAFLVLEALAGGLFSHTDESREFFENPVTTLTWVDFWVGLGIVSFLVGNLYERIAPLDVAGRGLNRVLGTHPLEYPARLGQWPAVVLLLAWSWL